jgi:hypothetical protein
MNVPLHISPIVKVATPAVMEQIHDVIRDMATPSWVQSVPYNFSDPGAGTLKADEWWTMITIYLPMAYGSHLSLAHAKSYYVSHLCCLACMYENHDNLSYHQYMAAWVSELTTLYPHVSYCMTK